MRVWQLFAVLVLVAATPSFGYDTLTEDYQICLGGGGKLPKEVVVDACTRLIDNAAKENSIIGMFYGLRASVNDDKAQNCKDAKKSLALAEDAKIKSLSKELIKINC